MYVITGMISGIVVGICYCKATPETEWLSKLGITTIIGLIGMVWSLYGAIGG